MKKQYNLLLLVATLLMTGCATPPPAVEQPDELPVATEAVSEPQEIEPELIAPRADCGEELSPEECANLGEHLYLQLVEAENICNDNGNDELVQFNISFNPGEVLVSDISSGETRVYANIDTNLYQYEKTFENGWVDMYMIKFTLAGFTEVYQYLDPDQGATLACQRITRTLDDGA